MNPPTASSGRPTPSAAFGMLESLVVMAILGIMTGLAVPVVQSLTQKDAVNSSLLVPAAGMEFLDRAMRMTGVVLQDQPTVGILQLPEVERSQLGTSETVNIQVRQGDNWIHFTRAIRFTPTGEAHAGETWTRYIELAVILSHRDKAPNQALLRVAGVTGKTRIYRN